MITEEQLRQAAITADSMFADSLPEPSECQHIFSIKFEKKMQKVLTRGNHPKLYRELRLVAGFLLAIFISGGVWLAVDAEARDAFFGWISERVEDAQHYFFGGAKSKETVPVRYELTMVPEGYQEAETHETENYTEVTFINQHKNYYLAFGYLCGADTSVGPEIWFAVENMDKSEAMINEVPAEFYLDPSGETGNLLVWTDDENDALLYLTGYFDKNELINMAESVQTERIF